MTKFLFYIIENIIKNKLNPRNLIKTKEIYLIPIYYKNLLLFIFENINNKE